MTLSLVHDSGYVIERAYHETKLAYRIEQTAVMQLEGMRSRFVHPEILGSRGRGAAGLRS